MKRIIFVILLICSPLTDAANQEKQISFAEFQSIPAESQLLILGTFHFKNAGLDSYKPEVDIDIFSDTRQAELEDVLQRIIKNYNPTKIAVEARGDGAKRLHEERYPAYLAGNFDLLANEIYQVAFNLGKRLKHERLYYVDVLGRQYENMPEDLEAYAQSTGQSEIMKNPWSERYFALYRQEDFAKRDRTLREIFLYMNNPDVLLNGHGHYVLRDIALGAGDDYMGADSITGWWYNRNLRIFSNLVKMSEPGDRVLLLIGAGHIPIIRHAAQASPEIELIEVSDVLGD